MADSFFDIAQELRPIANLTFNSKGEYADRVYTEQVTMNSAATGNPPPADSVSDFRTAVPAELIPGTYHPRCKYLCVVDANRSGGDDNHDNWQIIYRADLLRLATDFPATFSFPNALVNDGSENTNERKGPGGEDNVQVWKFTVINPQNYTAPPLYTTVHPILTASILVSEIMQRDGPLANVTRTYLRVPTDPVIGAKYQDDTVIPPAEFVSNSTIVTTTSIQPAAVNEDLFGNVVRSSVDPIDPARRTKTTEAAVYSLGAYQGQSGVLVGSDVDLDTGASYGIVKQLAQAGALGSGVLNNGQYTKADPVNTRWSILTTTHATTIGRRQWDEIINFAWPAVLESLLIIPITNSKMPVTTIVVPIWAAYAYSGPCQAQVVESWSVGVPSTPAPIAMIATPINYQGVFMNINVPNCLHNSVTFYETSGSNNPSYDFFYRTQQFNATNFTQWPTSIFGGCSVIPYRGGYLMRQTTVYPP